MGRPWEIDDGLWALIEPLLPPWPARSPGPRPVPDRLCLQGILFVLSTGIGWEDLPRELGYGSGMTCWRRLRRWTDAGVFDRLHRLLLAEVNAAGRIDWSRAIVDGGHIPAKKGAREPARPRPIRGRPGSKHHVITDGAGTPLAVLTTGGTVPDISRAVDLVDAVPPIAGRRGRPRRRFPCCWRTRATTAPGSAPPAGNGAPSRSSRSVGGSTSRDWAGCATSWNRASPCCTSSAAWPSDGNATSTSTRRWSASPAP